MQNIIELKRGAASWLAIHLGPHERETIRLFGQNALPTAFSPSAPPSAVLERIQSLNPDCTVRLAE